MTEDEMVGWHHRLNGHGFGWTPEVGDGQGSLVCCGSWGHKELDMTERLNRTEDNMRKSTVNIHTNQNIVTQSKIFNFKQQLKEDRQPY